MGSWSVNEVAKKLEQSGIASGREAQSLSRWIWEDVFGFPPSSKEELAAELESKMHSTFKRLAEGEPVQYIAGHAWFYGMKFKVTGDVLIPRPETEELVEWVYTDFKHETRPLRILDIGTGSGCIAITLKKILRHRVSVFAVDISSAALEVARANAQQLNMDVEFFHRDFLEDSFSGLGLFDIVVSNPPYVSKRDASKELMAGLQFEPELAIYPNGNDPDIFYQKILSEGRAALQPGGACYMELNEFRSAAVLGYARASGWSLVELRRDLQGLDRMLKVK